MSAKDLYRRFFEEGPNKGSLDVIEDVFSPDVRYYLPFGAEPVVGHEGVKGVVAGFRSAFPDLHIEIEELIEEGDKMVARVTVRGTNKGELMGNPPTGRRATWSVVHISHVESGRIVEDRITFDVLGFMQQLGLVPSPVAR